MYKYIANINYACICVGIYWFYMCAQFLGSARTTFASKIIHCGYEYVCIHIHIHTHMHTHTHTHTHTHIHIHIHIHIYIYINITSMHIIYCKYIYTISYSSCGRDPLINKGLILIWLNLPSFAENAFFAISARPGLGNFTGKLPNEQQSRQGSRT